MNNQPKISIVLVDYNGFKDSLECLESIARINYDNYNVILVDNGSKDNFLDQLKKTAKNFPFLKVIESTQNLGFTGGNNLGFNTAYQGNPDYIFCLNNDTVVTENILTELAAFMEKNQNYGLIGPLTHYYDDPGCVAFAGGDIDRNTGLITFISQNKQSDEIVGYFLPCSFIAGAALFIRTGLLKKIGGFNNAYFLTSEESELCIKVKDLGYDLGVLNSCAIFHKVSKTMVAESELASYFIFRNKLHFIKNNRQGMQLSDIIKVVKYYLVCFLSFGLKKNYSACKGIIMGVMDFFRGKNGAGRFE